MIEVVNAERFQVGDTVRINPGGATEEENTIVAIEGNTLELGTNLQFAHEAGEEVVRVIWTPRLRPPDQSPTPSTTATATPTAIPSPSPTETPSETDQE